MKKAVFLDRDGTLNKELPVENQGVFSNIEFFDFAPKAVASFKKKGYKTIIVTNKPVVARGICNEEKIHEVLKKTIDYFSQRGAQIDGYYFCPHHPEKKWGGNMKYRIKCNCRKPEPGMLFSAQRDHDIDFKKSYMIGDSIRDIAAGKAVGCKTILVKTGYGGKDRKMPVEPDFIVDNVMKAVEVVK